MHVPSDGSGEPARAWSPAWDMVVASWRIPAMASSQGDVRPSPMAYPAVRSLPKLPLPLRPEAEYLIVGLPVRPAGHQAQSLVIALRSPATKRSSDLNRYSPDIHPITPNRNFNKKKIRTTNSGGTRSGRPPQNVSRPAGRVRPPGAVTRSTFHSRMILWTSSTVQSSR